ncbi:MAG: methylmalonyl-CoA mutase, large subunit, partial [Enterovirga sp.]|nr:methylmalonyl-CoA mutase, large subunit [Enterovirga sp.]
MSRIPDFSTLPFKGPNSVAGAIASEPWITPEGIPVKPDYGPEDRAGLDFLDT